MALTSSNTDTVWPRGDVHSARRRLYDAYSGASDPSENAGPSIVPGRLYSYFSKPSPFILFLLQLDGHPRSGEQIPLKELEMDAVVAVQGGAS